MQPADYVVNLLIANSPSFEYIHSVREVFSSHISYQMMESTNALVHWPSVTSVAVAGGHWDLPFPWREDPHQMDGPRGDSLQEVHHGQWRVELRYRHVGGGFVRRETLLGHEQPGCESLAYCPTYEMSELIPENQCVFIGTLITIAINRIQNSIFEIEPWLCVDHSLSMT